MALDNSWFTEVYDKDGSAFSLKVKAKLLDEKTPYQHLEIYDTEEWGKLMVLDGCVMLTSRDNFFYHDMLAQPAMHWHPNPENVVIIGGGDCGSLREVLRHNGVKSAMQIEIDEAVTRSAEKYFPELCERNNDPRATLAFIDGVDWMKKQPDASIDVMLIDSTDPIGPAEALFGPEFLQDVFRVLKPGGILAQQSESLFYHLPLISELRSTLKTAGFVDCQTLPFPQAVYPSGWWSVTLARKGDEFGDIREAGLQCEYYSKAIHQAAQVLPPFAAKALGQ